MTRPTTREIVRELTLEGSKPRDIAAVLGLSTQAIYLHLTSLRDAGELPAKEAS
jgi:hypothetical protein